MKKSVLFAATLAACTLAQPLFAASNSWLGTWKLNLDKSTFTGSTYTVVKTGNVYHYDFGPLKFDIADDGKDYPVMPTHTSSLKLIGKNEWLGVDKVNGVEVGRSTLKLSEDGKTLTQVSTGTRPDGSTYKDDETDVRISGGPDLAGTWKNTKDSISAPSEMIYSDAGPNMLKIDKPKSKATATYPLDGKAVAETGPETTPAIKMGYKEVSPNELKYTLYYNGKLAVEGIETVSADGKVLKRVEWLVSKPAEKKTAIFEKQ